MDVCVTGAIRMQAWHLRLQPPTVNQATEADLAKRSHDWRVAFSQTDTAALFRKHPQLLLPDFATVETRFRALEEGLVEEEGESEGGRDEPVLERAVGFPAIGLCLCAFICATFHTLTQPASHKFTHTTKNRRSSVRPHPYSPKRPGPSGSAPPASARCWGRRTPSTWPEPAPGCFSRCVCARVCWFVGGVICRWLFFKVRVCACVCWFAGVVICPQLFFKGGGVR